MSNGSTTINDIFSGKIAFDDKLIQAYVAESEHYGRQDVGIDLSTMNNIIIEVIERTLDLLTQTGVVDFVTGGVEDLYAKLYKALIPSLLLATGIGTWASYWTSICEKDFDTALDLVFGKEGTETREEFSGLVDKIQYMRERIVIPRELEGEANLYKQFVKNHGVEIGVLAGYGLVQPPITESSYMTGDCTVDLYSSSFGATAAGVFDTLSDEYIAEREALGYGEYISADKKVDASTCLFPDTTWFVKNKHHDIGCGWEYIAERFCRYTNYTVNSNPNNVSRFIVATAVNGSSNFENMTEDNCQDGPWLDVVEKKPTTESKLASLMKFLTAIFKFITALFKGEINFDFFG